MPGIGIGISPTLKRNSSATPTPIGTVFKDNFNAADWTAEGVGVTYTFNPSNIVISKAGASYSTLLRYNKWTFMSENYTVKLNGIVNCTSNDVYIGTGIQSVSSFSGKPAFNCALWTAAGVNKGLFEIYYNNPTTGSNLVADSGAGRLIMNTGDEIEIEATSNKTLITFKATNLNPLTPDTLTVTYDNVNALVDPGTVLTILPNIFQPAIYVYKGNYTITGFELIDNTLKNINLLCVGDSKTQGYYASTFANRFVQIVASSTGKIVQVSAGSGNVTQDILNAIDSLILQNPKKVLLFIGRNDVASGISSVTWQANYISIVNQLESAGIEVWHQLPLPETVLNQSALTTFINANYTNIVGVPATWNTATDCSSDGTHESIAGNVKHANEIISTIPL